MEQSVFIWSSVNLTDDLNHSKALIVDSDDADEKIEQIFPADVITTTYFPSYGNIMHDKC